MSEAPEIIPSFIKTKTCTKCGLEQNISEFYTRKPRAKSESTIINRDQRQSDCKTCTNARCKSYRDAQPHHVKKIQSRTAKLRFHYGITNEYYDDLFAAQQGKCKICDDPQPVLNVDHCHASGRIRGLLCHSCNLTLGHFHDDVRILESAINYLRAAEPASFVLAA